MKVAPIELALALPSNSKTLRPYWKGSPRANPLAYWASSSVTKEKSFITYAPGGNVMKHFSSSPTKRYKLECLYLASLSSLVQYFRIRPEALGEIVQAHQPKWLKGLVRINAPDCLASLSGITA